LLLYIVTVSLSHSVAVNELTTTTDTNVILLPSFLAILTDMSGLTIWALHQN
jgi:hypothetical protein